MNAPFLTLPHSEPFYLAAEPGSRFCLFHAPDPRQPPRGAILYLPPFAEELNKTRRMAALQSRRFAAQGYAVLQMDLFGCGDSCGEFADARWAIWQKDVALGRAWLSERFGPAPYLWGVRLGALMALEQAARAPVAGLILWQPFLTGKTCISQFLRLQLAAQMRRSAGLGANSTTELRAMLAARGSLEVAGYTLAAELAHAIDQCDMGHLRPPACAIDWFALDGPANQKLEASVQRLAREWLADGASLHYHAYQGSPFWSANETLECPALLEATSQLFELETS